jgi:hypothetical protein
VAALHREGEVVKFVPMEEAIFVEVMLDEAAANRFGEFAAR